MAHELRAPLDTLIGLGALLGKSRLDSAQRNMVGTMQLAARTLSGLLGDLLELAKLGAGRPAPKPETFVLHQILGGTVSMLRPLAEEKGLGLALSIDPRLPAACRGLPAQLRQLLLNLIANAMKFTARGSIAVAASLAAHNEQNFTLRLAVREDGTGVPAAQRARIAARATPQADTSDGGLGLAIARELVELMGGSIAFGNQEGSGTIVTVDLPLIGQPDAAVPAPDLAGRLLLIVGPDQVLAAALQNLLKGWHGEAQWYADGEDLLVALGERGVEQRPILLLDGRSETLAGLSLAHRLAMRLARPPLILFIAPARGSEVIAGLAAAQLAAVIEAPVGETSLAAALLSILAAEPPSEGETQPAEPDLAPGLRVLIADDSSASRDLLKSLLASAGHGVEFAGDGGAALAALDREQFDLALLDVDMAGMGGDAVTQLHRLRHPGEKRPLMVALAAEDNAETERRCRSAGMDAVLRKPVNAVELQAVLDGLTTGEVEPIGVAPSPMVTPILAHPRFFADAGEVVHEPTVDALHTLGGPDFVAEVVQSFRSDAARLVDQLRGAVERGDLAAFGEFVHSLRSGAANVGGVRLTRMLTGLKDVTAKDLRQAGPFTVEKIAGELNRLEIALDAAMRVQRQG
jgi:two-component system sensor histidine kinase RpfC